MKRITAICLFLILSSSVSEAVVTGGETVYRVADGDSLPLISSKLGVDPVIMRRENKLGAAGRLKAGQELKLNTRKIAPKRVEDGIIIDIPGRMLYYFKAGMLEQSFPVGLGMPQWRGMTRWRTPVGAFTITRKTKNPVWYVPESIQWQMKAQGKPVSAQVPPGPDNPLGRFALYTSIRGIVIHETISPTSVYQFRSHGCIRVLPKDIERFYREVEVGMHGELVYEPVKVAVTDDRKVFLEVNRDVYGKAGKSLDEAIRRINALQASAAVDWAKITRMVHEQSGVAEDVTLLTVKSSRGRAEAILVPTSGRQTSGQAGLVLSLDSSLNDSPSFPLLTPAKTRNPSLSR
jgi:L,D-transpeptidase ErfK/SrfK